MNQAAQLQEFPCKTSGCTGKVHFIDKPIPAIVASKKVKSKKTVEVDLTCDNTASGPHTNTYQVIIER